MAVVLAISVALNLVNSRDGFKNTYYVADLSKVSLGVCRAQPFSKATSWAIMNYMIAFS